MTDWAIRKICLSSPSTAALEVPAISTFLSECGLQELKYYQVHITYTAPKNRDPF